MKLYHSQIYPLTPGCILLPEITICQKPYTHMVAASFSRPMTGSNSQYDIIYILTLYPGYIAIIRACAMI